MDITLLRSSSNRFMQGLKSKDNPTIIHIISDILQLDKEEFIWEAYKQILLREPEELGFQSHLQQLHAGMPKLHIMDGLLQSEEAQRMYEKLVLPAGSYIDYALGRLLHSLYQVNGFELIQTLYREFLCRNSDFEGLHHYLHLLDTGMPYRSVISGFLLSEECQRIVRAIQYPELGLTPTNYPVKHIGIFLGYHHQVTLDGEGIGSFIVRLIEGWLLNNQDIKVHVATTEGNTGEVERLLNKHVSALRSRVFIRSFPDMAWLNRNVSVDIWCVPYVGLKWALELQRPFILCVHDLVYLHFRDLYYSKQPEFFQSLDPIVSAMANKASKVVFNSNFIRDNEGLRFLELPLSKTQVIRLAAPIEEYRASGICEEPAFRQTYNLKGPYLVFPSIMRLHKNHDRLIEAFLNFKQTPEGISSNLSLVLTDHYVNRPFEKEITALMNRCTTLDELNSIVFLGRVASNHIPSLYKYAAGTIVPTLFEGSCPFPILESLTVDTPVAISRIEVAVEVIDNMAAFITFDPYSVVEIEAAIVELWRRHEALAAVQKAAISAALHRSWTDVAGEYEALFNSVISAK
jgi:glycosyltransferase involved in cell wall biosynthesis